MVRIGAPSREHQIDLIRARDANGIRPVIASSFALTDIADAFRHQKSRSHSVKIALAW